MERVMMRRNGVAGRHDRVGILPGVGLVLLALGLGGADIARAQPLAEETPVNIIAVHVRQQGYACNEPRRAERNVQASKPNEAVWLLVCENATYRVTLVPNMAARIALEQ
jgi:hypothetical protein